MCNYCASPRTPVRYSSMGRGADAPIVHGGNRTVSGQPFATQMRPERHAATSSVACREVTEPAGAAPVIMRIHPCRTVQFERSSLCTIRLRDVKNNDLSREAGCFASLFSSRQNSSLFLCCGSVRRFRLYLKLLTVYFYRNCEQFR